MEAKRFEQLIESVREGGAIMREEVTPSRIFVIQEHLYRDMQWRPFIHELGEEGGRKPHAKLYKNGRLGFLGGDYTVTSLGIEN